VQLNKKMALRGSECFYCDRFYCADICSGSLLVLSGWLEGNESKDGCHVKRHHIYFSRKKWEIGWCFSVKDRIISCL